MPQSQAYLHERDGDLETAARLYADAAHKAPNLAERDHLTRQAARLNASRRLADEILGVAVRAPAAADGRTNVADMGHTHDGIDWTTRLVALRRADELGRRGQPGRRRPAGRAGSRRSRGRWSSTSGPVPAG